MTPNVMALLCPVSGLPWAIMSSRWHCTLSDLAFSFQFQDNVPIVLVALFTIVAFFSPAVNILGPPSHATADVEPKKCNQRNWFTNQFCYKLHNLAWSIDVGFVVHKSRLIKAVSRCPVCFCCAFLVCVSLKQRWQSIWNHNSIPAISVTS